MAGFDMEQTRWEASGDQLRLVSLKECELPLYPPCPECGRLMRIAEELALD